MTVIKYLSNSPKIILAYMLLMILFMIEGLMMVFAFIVISPLDFTLKQLELLIRKLLKYVR
jgi:hypothetical protein